MLDAVSCAPASATHDQLMHALATLLNLSSKRAHELLKTALSPPVCYTCHQLCTQMHILSYRQHTLHSKTATSTTTTLLLQMPRVTDGHAALVSDGSCTSLCCVSTALKIPVLARRHLQSGDDLVARAQSYATSIEDNFLSPYAKLQMHTTMES
eukprot:3498614-Amphidinium_carterae.2